MAISFFYRAAGATLDPNPHSKSPVFSNLSSHERIYPVPLEKQDLYQVRQKIKSQMISVFDHPENQKQNAPRYF